MDIIPYFNGQYRYLSNFYIEPDGSHVEGEFQAAKCPQMADRFKGLSPREAKALGRQVRLRPDWDAVKLDIMYQLVFKKFDTHVHLANQLWQTRPALLEEGNTWGDTFWGVCDGIGHNHLGRILMRVRWEVIPF